MSTGDRDRLLDHDYDGIKEYDNPLPSWWVWIFWATIVFSAGYWGYYHLGPGPTILEIHEAESRAAAEVQARVAPGASEVTDDSVAALVKDAALMASAKQVYNTRCAACHGAQGQGVIGPNLTDEWWIHGGKPTEIVRVIAEGVPDKGMVPWKGLLQPREIQAVSAYILSIAGTNPPSPKPPQGVNASGARAPGWQP